MHVSQLACVKTYIFKISKANNKPVAQTALTLQIILMYKTFSFVYIVYKEHFVSEALPNYTDSNNNRSGSYFFAVWRAETKYSRISILSK